MPSTQEVLTPIEPTGDNAESLMIACASYEDRSTAVCTRLHSGFRADRSIILSSKEYANKGKTRENWRTLSDVLCNVCNQSPHGIEFAIDQPIKALIQVKNIIMRWNEEKTIDSITIDISTLPRQEMLILLQICDSLPWKPAIRLLYSEPAQYDTENENGWLTRGVKSVSPVIGFGGIQPPGKGKLLLMFLGHESERTAITWKRHQPDITMLLSAYPSYRPELDGIIEKTHSMLLTELSSCLPCVQVPSRGIDEVEELVLKIWKLTHDQYYMMIAPLGTKLQTLGIYRAAQRKRDIQITYAVPSIYNYNRFSTGIGRIWEIVWDKPLSESGGTKTGTVGCR